MFLNWIFDIQAWKRCLNCIYAFRLFPYKFHSHRKMCDSYEKDENVFESSSRRKTEVECVVMSMMKSEIFYLMACGETVVFAYWSWFLKLQWKSSFTFPQAAVVK